MKTRNFVIALLTCILVVPAHGQIELKKHSPNLVGNNALM